MIVEHCCVDNLVWVLQWSSEPHGSPWVQRQALQLLREDFLQVAHSPALNDLTKEHLLQAVQSDFLQVKSLLENTGKLKILEKQRENLVQFANLIVSSPNKQINSWKTVL